MKKILNYLPILIIVILHILILIPMAIENKSRVEVLIPITLIIILIGLFFRNQFKQNQQIEFNNFLVSLGVFIGGILTFWISVSLGFGSVVGASLVGFTASFLPNINSKSFVLKQIPSAIYCGTFVGMTSSFVAESYLFVLIASTLAMFIFMITKNALNGYGGKLGTIAFGGVVFCAFIFYLFQ